MLVRVNPEIISKFPVCGYCGDKPKFLETSFHSPIGWNIAFAALGGSISYKISWAICEKCSKRPKKFLITPFRHILFSIIINYIYFKFFVGHEFQMIEMFVVMLFPISLLLTAIEFSKNDDTPFVIKKVYNDHSMDVCFKNEKIQKQFEEFLSHHANIHSEEAH